MFGDMKMLVRDEEGNSIKWNVDIFGADPVKSEVEIFMMLVEFLKELA